MNKFETYIYTNIFLSTYTFYRKNYKHSVVSSIKAADKEAKEYLNELIAAVERIDMFTTQAEDVVSLPETFIHLMKQGK